MIGPYSLLQLPFAFSIKPGSFNDYLEFVIMNMDTSKVKIEIESYGYHLASHDLQIRWEDLNTFRHVGNELLYLREYDECEMKIYEFDKARKPNPISTPALIATAKVPVSIVPILLRL